MDEHMYDNEFERFLQQEVKHHRMYPSDAVWKGIYQQMHGDKKWPGLYFFAILMVAALTVCTIFIESEPIIYPATAVTAKSNIIYEDRLDPEKTTARTLQLIRANQPSVVADIPMERDKIELVATSKVTRTSYMPAQELNAAALTESFHTIAFELPGEKPASIDNTAGPSEVVAQPVVVAPSNVKKASRAARKKSTIDLSKAKTPSGIDAYLAEHPEESDRIAQQKVRTKPSRWQIQYYIAPSMSHRKIADTRNTLSTLNGPVASNMVTSAGKIIRYNPGMGIEMGIGAMYNLTSRIRVKAGIQYNIRQYAIEAYSTGTELARIEVQRGRFVDTIMALTRYSSTGGIHETELLNKYHQLSMPLGLEYALLNGKRLSFNIAASLQPTYTFSPSTYLLTTDFKNYADGTSMVRKWNINSSLEATFGLKSGNIQWRFGPQLRYQHLPTYTDGYSVREYLFDYGFKIGFTKTIQ